MWDVTAVDGQQASTFCCTLCVCRVKGAIHEQLAGVKSGKGWAAVYDCERIYAFVSVNVFARAHPYVCQCAAIPDTDVVTTKWVFDFYQRDQIALEEDHLVVGSWVSLL